MRLTKKDIAYITSGANVIEIPDIVEGYKYTGQAIIKLGQLEDKEEKYNIKSIDDLDDRLKVLEIIKKKTNLTKTNDGKKALVFVFLEMEKEFDLLKEVLVDDNI